MEIENLSGFEMSAEKKVECLQNLVISLKQHAIDLEKENTALRELIRSFCKIV